MHIFIAFPFSQLIEQRTGRINKEYIEFLDKLRKTLIDLEYNVFLAHYREEWGEKLMGPYECTPDDFSEMCKTDLVLAFPGWPASGGVHVELGWASALGKRIVLFLKEEKDYSPLVFGLSTITEAQLHYYDDLSYEKLLPAILEGISETQNEQSA